MTNHHPAIGPKVHPAAREILPDDPLAMHGFEIPGDPELMLRLLAEEYARIGWGLGSIMQLARDPNYQAFHGLFQRFGEEGFRVRIVEILSRCGVIRVRTEEARPSPDPDAVVQLDLPTTCNSTRAVQPAE